MTASPPASQDRARRNLRTGLILGAIALAFALIFVLKTWHYG